MILNITLNKRSICTRSIPDNASLNNLKEFSAIVAKVVPPQIVHALLTKQTTDIHIQLLNEKGSIIKP